MTPGERLVLCTDGVIEGLWDHAIRDLASSTDHQDQQQSAAEGMVLSAVAESGRDNSTAIIVEAME
jgi:protein phosphatase